MKLIGYTEVVHTLLSRLSNDASIVMFGGLARDRRTPARRRCRLSTAACTAWSARWRPRIAPIRINCLHPGIVGDSPFWAGKAAALESVRARTPTGRTATMADIVDTVDFLLRNRSVNGIEIAVDGGWLLS